MKAKLIWCGRAANWLGDLRHQVLLQVTPELGISILGPEHRCDYLHGLPDRKSPGYDQGSNMLLQALVSDTEALFKVAVVRFLQPTEHPLIPADKTGRRFQPVGYQGCGDSYNRSWSGSEIQSLIELIHDNGTTGIDADDYLDSAWNRTTRYYTFIEQLKAWKTQIYLDKTNGCSANPHPEREPREFAYCNLNGRLPEKPYIIRGIYCWTTSIGYFGFLVLATTGSSAINCIQINPPGGNCGDYNTVVEVNAKFLANYPASLAIFAKQIPI